jgi:hypothetical protein
MVRYSQSKTDTHDQLQHTPNTRAKYLDETGAYLEIGHDQYTSYMLYSGNHRRRLEFMRLSKAQAKYT